MMNTPYKSKHKSLGEESIARIVNKKVDDPYTGALKTMLFTGARTSEVLGLGWKDFDKDHKIVHIHQQLSDSDGSTPEIKSVTKNYRSRWVALGDMAVDTLNAVGCIQTADREIAGDGWSDKYGLIFTDKTGKPLKSADLTKALHRLLQGTEDEKSRVYDLRHTAATVGYRMTKDIKAVQKMLGHTSPEITDMYYIDSDSGSKERVAGLMDEYYRDVLGEGNDSKGMESQMA